MSWPTPSVRGVLLDDKKRVLLREDGARWRLPGAKFIGGLTWLEVIRAAILDETGLAAEEETLVGLYTDEGRVVASFRVTRFQGEVRGARWFDTSALPELAEGDRARIEDALTYRGEVFQR